MELAERAYQSLEVVTRRGTAPTVAHIWRALAEVTPAIASIYEAVGSQFRTDITPFPKELRMAEDHRSVASAINWERVLRRVFCVEHSERGHYSLVDAGRHVSATGFIGADDVAHGILQSGRDPRGWEKSRLTNPVLRHMARHAGISKSRNWSPTIDQFSQRAIVAWRSILGVDPSLGGQQFILYHDGDQYRIAPFGVTGGFQLQEAPLPDGSLWIARGNVLQPPTRFTEAAIHQLESLINSDALESEFQRFFEAHPEFLATLGGYSRAHPQLVLHEDDGGRLIPDFFLEKINSDFCDICDLKRATAELVRAQRHRIRFRDCVMEGVAQLDLYRSWFDDRDHRAEFQRRYGLQAYRPRVVLIIGRQRSYYDDVERIRLETGLPAWMTLKTYDDVVALARQWRLFAAS